MYTREIQAPVDTPIINGKPIAGTWARPFAKVNLLEIEKPYPIPFPKWLINLRIKEWQSFVLQNDEVYFEAFAANLKFFRFIETTFYDKKEKNAEPVHYFDFFPFTLWSLPQSLFGSSVICRGPGYFVTIHDWLDASCIKLDVNIDSGIDNPSLNAIFEFYTEAKTTPLSVNLLFCEDRSLYSYKTICPVRGTLKMGANPSYTFSPEKTTGIFRDCKGMFPYGSRSSWVNSVGIDKNGRRIGFSMGEHATRAANRDNENALWVDGNLTPLPPVRITQSQGFSSDWIIEDVEGMVDLTFTPKKQVERTSFNIILARAELCNPIGVFNGFVMTRDGEKIEVQNMFGSAERLYLRL
jgi:hypothetical protein